MEAKERMLAEEVERKTAELSQAQRRLERHSEELEQRVEERTRELRQAQGMLVQSEKIAALGQLVAGVAHEVNNPLGAINAAATDAREQLHALPRDWSKLYQWCTEPEELERALSLLEALGQPREYLDFRERRRLGRRHRQQLESEGIEQADLIAEELVHMGLVGDLQRWLPLFRHSEVMELLELLGRFAAVAGGINDICRAVQRASKIVFSLSRYQHHDPDGKPTLGRLQDGLETVLTLYHHLLKHGIGVECDFHDVPPLLGFHDELNQVWTNLIQNAVHAMGGEGTLRLTLRAVGDGQVVTVEDDGGGIPEWIIERIFEPFFTTKPAGEGTGLGLSICKQIVDRHGGVLDIRSRPGEGTTFIVQLPNQLPNRSVTEGELSPAAPEES